MSEPTLPPTNVGSNDQLGASAEANEPPRAYFSEGVVRRATLTAAEEARVRRRECPKCGDAVYRTSDGPGVRFSQCIGCGCIFVVSA